MFRKFSCFILLCCFSCCVFAQKNIKKKPKKSSPQVVYSLPKTMFAIEVNMKKTETRVGPYFRYCERYLAIRDVCTEDNVSYEVQSLNIKTLPVPDKDKTFQINAMSALWVNEIGVICGLNIPPMIAEETAKVQVSNEAYLDKFAFDYRAYYEDQLLANSIAKMAESAAKQIYSIRESRMALISGDNERVPTDGQSLQIMLEELDKAEQSLMELFVGKKVVTTETYTYYYTPSNKSTKDEVIFRVSPTAGVVEKDDLSGLPVYLTISANKNDIPPVDLKNGGELFYNIVGTAFVQLKVENKMMFEQTMSIAQMGTLQALPSKFKTYKLRFDPNTGALIGLEK